MNNLIPSGRTREVIPRGHKTRKIILGIGIILVCLSLVSAITWRSNGTETMSLDDSGNLSVIGNITTSDTGFFGWLGSLVNRITKLWVGEINATGNIVTSENVTASYLFGDGSQLTGITGGLWTNSSGNATFTSGRVGIGTSSPESPLEIENTLPLIEFNYPAVYSYQIGMDDGTYSDIYDFIIRDKTTNNVRLAIKNYGYVGIGTTDPVSGLTVAGNDTSTSAISAIRYGANAYGGYLNLRNTRGANDTDYTIVQDGDTLGTIRFYGADGVDWEQSARINVVVNGTPASDSIPSRMDFLTTNAAASTATRMSIGSEGNVGIGTTAPSSKLDVYGGNITLTNSTASENNYFKFGRGGYMYDNGTAVIIGHY